MALGRVVTSHKSPPLFLSCPAAYFAVSLRKLDRPKAKKIRHVAPTATVLRGESLATDKQLAAAVKAFDAQHPAKP